MSSSPHFDAVETAVLGPTNTGKTRLAIERMTGRASGVIGLPLRLLAREVYDRIVEIKGRAAVALVTGEEKIAPESARYFVCTVEAMPIERKFAFVAIDEIQLCSDPDRGHVFTDRLLNMRGTEETMLLGADTLRPIVRTLAPRFAHDQRTRFSTLTHVGHMKLTKLPRRSAIVAFSAEEVYAIAELLRRQRGGAAVVMGALSPRTRNAQVALYQSGEVDFLVATDAIGMGLNMDVDHVAFASLTKFDGTRRRPLRPEELAQIAGRAGRYTRDGTFGTTGDARAIPELTIARIEGHQFDPASSVHWRASNLSFDSPEALKRSLAAHPPHEALRRTRDAIDEAVLAHLMDEPEIADRARGQAAVRRLWSACQIPDFRKVTLDQHVRLVAVFARQLLTGRGQIAEDWIAAETKKLDDTTGEVDALASRLAHIRTWTYAANRRDWLADPAGWQAATRAIEDRLSDALHERLTQRFVDRRTSALVKGLKDKDFLHPEIFPDGSVEVEGHFVGRLDGLEFRADRTGAAAEVKAVRHAAERALRPVIDRRLGQLAAAPDEAFTLGDDLSLRWDGRIVGRLARGNRVLEPAVRLIGGELGSATARARAERRLETVIAHGIARDLAPLLALEAAVTSGAVTGLARGIAYRASERFGNLVRAEVAEEVRALSSQERRALRAIGFTIGEHAVFLPKLLKPKAARLLGLLVAAERGEPLRLGANEAARTSLPASPDIDTRAYAAAGRRVFGPRAIRLDVLETLAQRIRAERGPDGAFPATTEMAQLLGCPRAELGAVLKALGYTRAKTAAPATPEAPAAPERWRARRPKRRPTETARAAVAAPPTPDNPFAALAVLRKREG